MKTGSKPDTALGDLLREARERRGMSVYRLAHLTGVSRKHIDNAEAGLNISVLVLRKLLAPLGIEEVAIRANGSPRAASLKPVADAGAIADQLEEATTILHEVARRLRSGASVGSPNAVADRAEKLITSFADFVRAVDDVEQLEQVERSVSSLAVGAGRPRRRVGQGRRSR